MKKLLLAAVLAAAALGAHAQVVEGVQASDGVVLPIAQLAQAIAYTTCNANSVIQTVTVKWGQGTYVQTFTYNGSCLVTNVSIWVRQ